MLEVGQSVPTFKLPDGDMEEFDFESLRGQFHTVLFFYPKDGTPLCAKEAQEFSDHEDDFNRLNCQIFGISQDDCLSHAEFRDKQGLSVRLLSDESGEVCRAYGVKRMREVAGHRKLCVVRSTFIIDKEGILRHVFYDVNPKGHVAEVFQLVKGL